MISMALMRDSVRHLMSSAIPVLRNTTNVMIIMLCTATFGGNRFISYIVNNELVISGQIVLKVIYRQISLLLMMLNTFSRYNNCVLDVIQAYWATPFFLI